VNNIQAIDPRYQGFWKELYNEGITCWMLSRGDPATFFKRKSCSIHL